MFDLLKEKVLYQLQEHALEEKRILQDTISGQEGIMSQQLGRDEANDQGIYYNPDHIYSE